MNDASPLSPSVPPPRPESGEHHSLTVSDAQSGQRIDRLLAETLPGLSRSRIKALIEGGHLTCSGVLLREPAHVARTGMAFALTVPPAAPARPEAEHHDLPILFEDRDLIVIDKPAGLVVHPAPGNESGTLVNALLGHCGEDLEGIGGEKRPGIVHRLDKDTSGLMVAAKTPLAHQALSNAFAARTIDRAYLALAWGVLPAETEFDGPIGRDRRDRKRMAVVTGPTGKHALTRVRRLDLLHHAVSLVECRLATGRTHQIRVHLSHAGHPLLGDPVYLRRIPAAARALPAIARAAALDFPRQALHAARLGFTHPRTGEALLFTSEPPADFRALLTALQRED
ncbi:RluA family pseudouridine synthase [Acidomonas methanolica]|uniref:Pseudouridine synthase n=1 Tax=Acidomonas methanolica NBRC 104435 TaxID=1231351 RepID=A0A023D475_ACIMT|nr:RluA family pseudouridine synthase [Acidomonas methanolica]MBU2654457.1 RluA family pseudouridine synthase [Acidomonas methanolica]TCS28260.1 23S rRNA pseudouridine1911/1915/1917 synthase [Acidomonas methanolica]GAJ28606.1 ribosomal 23S RNA pseudouridine synthase RluA [Acidomonas methanolica NBRC 104435]GBQ45918.1 ribosomal RNA large subunit 23S rRNA pseudouridine synthase D [Acidomonas methanolica]GEK98977.1 pseudouridine synthase [Acidomonas methanolica NBRC 104435]